MSVLDEEELEKDPAKLTDEVLNLLADKTRLQAMGRAFHTFAKPNAAKDMAEMILAAAK